MIEPVKRRAAGRNKLWTVRTGGATYWVVAKDFEDAALMVMSEPDQDPGNECIGEETSAEDQQRIRFRFEDGNSCSLANAFELRGGYVGVLSCSEWP